VFLTSSRFCHLSLLWTLQGKDIRMSGSEGTSSSMASQCEVASSSTKVRSEEVEKYPIEVQKTNGHSGNTPDFPREHAPSIPPHNAFRTGRKMSFAYGMTDSIQRHFGDRTYSTLTTDRARNMRFSMRVPDVNGSIINKKADPQKEEVKEVYSQDIGIAQENRVSANDGLHVQESIRISNN
jgi:hypothetical protein